MLIAPLLIPAIIISPGQGIVGLPTTRIDLDSPLPPLNGPIYKILNGMDTTHPKIG